MKSALIICAVGTTLVSGLSATTWAAEEKPAASLQTSKALPVLLIKGEVVSVDASDTNATLLKVKDRYGFETPIYVTPDAKVTKGDAPVAMADLTAGTPVGVEYNFDVNTAKRHAVSVKVEAPQAAATTPAAPSPAATPAAVPAPAASTPPAAMELPGAPPVAPAPAAPATPAAPAATSSAPSQAKPANQ